VVTGRILPSTLRHEIYTLEAALNKLGDVNEVFNDEYNDLDEEK
jgi:hypothetical protein